MCSGYILTRIQLFIRNSCNFFDFLLEKANVVGTPGEGFGENGKGYFRLTSFGDRDNTIEAVERIKNVLR